MQREIGVVGMKMNSIDTPGATRGYAWVVFDSVVKSGMNGHQRAFVGVPVWQWKKGPMKDLATPCEAYLEGYVVFSKGHARADALGVEWFIAASRRFVFQAGGSTAVNEPAQIGNEPYMLTDADLQAIAEVEATTSDLFCAEPKSV